MTIKENTAGGWVGGGLCVRELRAGIKSGSKPEVFQLLKTIITEGF